MGRKVHQGALFNMPITKSLENGALIEFQWPPPASSAIIHTHLQEKDKKIRKKNIEQGVNVLQSLVAFNITAEEGPNSDIELEEEAQEPPDTPGWLASLSTDEKATIFRMCESMYDFTASGERAVIARMMNRFSLCVDDAHDLLIFLFGEKRERA